MKTLTVIIPVYNESRFIQQTLHEVIESDSCGLNKEIILVDDHSQDDTVSIINAFIKKYRRSNVKYKLITKPKNIGKGHSVKEGILASTGDIVIIQDADLEYSPSDYPEILEPFFEFKADAVYGNRFFSNKPHRVLYYTHFLANQYLTVLSNLLTGFNLGDMETGFKAFRGNLIRFIAPRLRSKRFGFEPEVTARLAKTPRIKLYEVSVSYMGRTYEEGKKIGWKDGFVAVWVILRYNLF